MEETQRQRVAFGAGIFDDSATPSQNCSFLFDFGGRGLQRLLDIHNHRTDFGVGYSLLSFVIRRWTKGGEKSGEGEEEGGGERRWRRSRHTSHRCARPGTSLSSKINAREPLLARELGLLSRRPFDSGCPRPITTDPFGYGLCRLADMWVSGPVMRRMQSKSKIKIEFRLNFKLNFGFKKKHLKFIFKKYQHLKIKLNLNFEIKLNFILNFELKKKN